MSHVEYADPLAPAPRFGPPEAPDPHRVDPRAVRAMRYATIPFAISAGAHIVFFLNYWLPEIGGSEPSWWLQQLAPLSSKYLVSGGEPLTELQEDSPGIAATLLLILSLVILWMTRSRHWMARTWISAPVLAGAAVCVVTIALLAVQRNLGAFWLSVLLMICWAGAAGMAAWLSFGVDIDALPAKGHRSGLVILIAYILLGAPPTAVGRLLFAPELRQAAEELQQSNEALRNEALALPTNFWVYLAGVLVGLVVWLSYQIMPPSRDRRTGILAAALVGSLIALLVLGALVTRPAALAQTQRIYTESPADRIGRTCGMWIVDPAAPVERTVVIDGSDCRELTSYEGYIQREMQLFPDTLANLNARTPESVPIRSRLISARYDRMLVVVSSDQKDRRATTVRGILLSGSIQVWQWSCASPTDLTVRFAAVPGVVGDDSYSGYITLPGETSSVVVGCPSLLKHLDPRTGLGKA
jgi:hypothetical protein